MLRTVMLSIAGNDLVERTVRRSEISANLARRFVAGDTLDDAIEVIRKLNSDGMTVALDALGENVSTEAAAKAASDEYCSALDRIAGAGVISNISIKLTMLGLDVSDDVCNQYLTPILQKARDHGNFVRIDMEGSAYTQRTLDIFYEAHERYGDHVGIVLQSMLYRTDRDVRQAIERGARVRLVKGAYAEPATIAYPGKREVDAAFRRQMEMLLDGGNYPAIATHDEALINMAKAYTGFKRIDRDRFEFQMLYGVRRNLHEQLISEGYGMRIYTPYGDQWYPYFTRRMAERPANLFFVLRNLVRP